MERAPSHDASWPYGYYVFLRVVVCACAGFLAWQQWLMDARLSGWVALLAGIAFLFNPVLPIYLNRPLWAILDLGTAAALFVHFRVVRERVAAMGEASAGVRVEVIEPDGAIVRRGSDKAIRR